MATKFYFGDKPLLSQPSRGGSKTGRAFIGGEIVYGVLPEFESGVLDTYTGASAAYSLRRLTIDYTGPAIQVTRTSDSATQDINFKTGYAGRFGDLDTDALEAFAGSNTCVINKWYDQSGNADHMTQTTQANMPTIVSSGTLLKQGGKPAARFDGTNDAMTATNNNPFSFTGGMSIISAMYKDSGAYNTYETILSAGATGVASSNNRDMKFFGFPNAGSVSPKPAIGTDIWSPSGVQVDASVSTDTRMLIGWYISNWSTHRSSGLSNIRLNGSDQTTKTYGTNNPDAHNTNAMKMGVGDEILTPSFLAGDIQEILVWNTDKNSDRVGIETDVNTYWGIY